MIQASSHWLQWLYFCNAIPAYKRKWEKFYIMYQSVHCLCCCYFNLSANNYMLFLICLAAILNPVYCLRSSLILKPYLSFKVSFYPWLFACSIWLVHGPFKVIWLATVPGCPPNIPPVHPNLPWVCPSGCLDAQRAQSLLVIGHPSDWGFLIMHRENA